MAVDHLLEGLAPDQQAAVQSEAAPLCIIAGAGTGKTRVLTRRIAWRVANGSADASHVLALTFTRKAAGELSTRLGRLGVRDRVTAGTFHAIAYAQLRQRWADRGERLPAILQSKVGILFPMLKGGPKGGLQAIEVAGEIEWAKARLIRPDGYEAAAGETRRQTPAPAGVIAGLYERYERERRKRVMVDLDDLLVLCGRALAEDSEFAAAQRWRFRHLFVDEFQDVNPAQHHLLQHWMGEGTDLCVVGDPNQAIYSWNGAEPRYLTEFPDRHPTAEVLRLSTNYRCSPQVVTVAKGVLGSDGRLLDSAAEAGPVPIVHALPDEHTEAAAIARLLRRASNSRRWSAMAVLVRTNAQTAVIQQALTRASIPCRVRGGNLLASQEVKDALALLVRGTTLYDWTQDLEEMLEVAPPERRANLEALLALAREHMATVTPTDSATFRSWLQATMAGEDLADTGDAVELCTFHKAKGLEWDLVIVAGVEDGFVPISHAASSDEGLAEERRLLYVAITRAATELHLTWAAERTFGSRKMRRSRSPHLDAIDEARFSLGAERPANWQAGVAAARKKLPAKPDPADPLLVALTTWRRDTAKAANVPAYVVFNDKTLAAICERRPKSAAELASVYGLGPVKVERFGSAVLDLVAQHRAS